MEKNLNILKDNLLSCLKDKDLQEVKKILEKMNYIDIAHFFDELNKNELTLCFNLLSKDVGAKVFAEMNIEKQKLLIEGFSDFELEEIINDIRMDDKVDMIEELPSNLVKKILKNSNPEDRRIINIMLTIQKIAPAL